MSGGQYGCPIVFRGPTGNAGMLSSQHSQNFENWYANTPGLKVVVPSNPYGAKGLLKSSIRDNDPVVFLESEKMYGDKGEIPEGEYIIPIGVADIKRKGTDVTIVTFGKIIKVAQAAAEELEKEGISIEIIDLRTIRPIDYAAVVESVKKTNRCVVVEESWPLASISSEISYHLQRYALAATLSSNTGVYGPVYEFLESAAIPGKEEYHDSEKYEFRHWDWNKENNLTRIMSTINHARKQMPSLQQTNNIEFLEIDNHQLLAFHKWDFESKDRTLVVVNLDPHYSQKGWVKIPLSKWGISEGHTVRVFDVVTEDSYVWNQEFCFIELHPVLPFHIFKVEL
jgi:hypothetical protein